MPPWSWGWASLSDFPLVVAGAALAVAALFGPARRRIQAAVDRRFNRRRHNTAERIAAFGDRLHQQVDLDTLTVELLAVVDQTMQPTQVSLWLRPPGSTSQDQRIPGVASPAAWQLATPRPFAQRCEQARRCHRAIPAPRLLPTVPSSNCPRRGRWPEQPGPTTEPRSI